MQIVFHFGAHCTDNGHIQACLVKNRKILAKEGTFVPNPGRFRPILRETTAVLQGAPANTEVQKVMLASILKDAEPKRVIFSNDSFLCSIHRALADDMLYPDAASRSRNFRNLFPEQDVTFCLAIRNPATFLPASFAKVNAGDFVSYIAQVDPISIRWSDTIAQIQNSNPGIPIKIWSNEDTPFIWPDLIRKISGLGPEAPLEGLNDYLASIMTAEGMERMNSYLESHPPTNETQRRRILSAFLDKFEAEDESDVDVSAPEWTEDFINELTDNYEEDLYKIEGMPGVQFIGS